MSTSTRATLINYFITGSKPTQSQFADFINAVFNLNDDTVTMDLIEGLTDALAGKASTALVTTLSDAIVFLQKQTLAAGAVSYNIPADTLIEKIIVLTPVTEINFKIGTTNGGNELYDVTDLPIGYRIIAQDMYFANATTIYFGGVAADTIIKICQK